MKTFFEFALTGIVNSLKQSRATLVLRTLAPAESRCIFKATHKTAARGKTTFFRREWLWADFDFRNGVMKRVCETVGNAWRRDNNLSDVAVLDVWQPMLNRVGEHPIAPDGKTADCLHWCLGDHSPVRLWNQMLQQIILQKFSV